MTATAISLERGDDVALERGRMFKAFVQEMNRSRIPYCLLSGYERFPDPGESDVDFMVPAEDLDRIAPLLQRVARRTGALLVQALQHETEACYYVLARRVGDGVAYLRPDCTADYRRDGRLWLRASDVMARCRRNREFCVPSEEDEFVYYLIKKVLKQSADREQMRRLRHLYVSRPERCCERLQAFLRPEIRGALVSALLRLDEEQMCRLLPRLLRELMASKPVERRLDRWIQSGREVLRRAGRVIRPTGIGLGVSGANATERRELIGTLERNLKPVFRRTTIVAEEERCFPVRQWMARVRSTLVLMSAPAVHKRFGNTVWWDLSDSINDAGRWATDFALQTMAARLTQRTRARRPIENGRALTELN